MHKKNLTFYAPILVCRAQIIVPKRRTKLVLVISLGKMIVLLNDLASGEFDCKYCIALHLFMYQWYGISKAKLKKKN